MLSRTDLVKNKDLTLLEIPGFRTACKQEKTIKHCNGGAVIHTHLLLHNCQDRDCHLLWVLVQVLQDRRQEACSEKDSLSATFTYVNWPVVMGIYSLQET